MFNDIKEVLEWWEKTHMALLYYDNIKIMAKTIPSERLLAEVLTVFETSAERSNLPSKDRYVQSPIEF